MEAMCGKCHTRLRINIPENYQYPNVQFKCSNCGAINDAPVRPSAPGTEKPTQVFNNPQSERTLVLEPGWLVVHDENAKTQTYALKPGKMVIGKKNTTKKNDIGIETKDPYMSRTHCIVEVRQTRSGNYEYILSDPGYDNGFSLNGTTINADSKKRLGPNDKLYLVDGDVIQAGRTKIVIKTAQTVSNKDEAEKTVIVNDYSKTVIL